MVKNFLDEPYLWKSDSKDMLRILFFRAYFKQGESPQVFSCASAENLFRVC